MSESSQQADLDALVERVESLEQENRELRSLVDALNRKVNNQMSFDEPEVEFGDWRDRKVVGSLERGSEYTTRDLVAQYESAVGMTNEGRIRERVKRLADSCFFVNISHGVFEFRGDGE